MRMEETLLIYLLIGLAVGAALAWRDRRRAAFWLTFGVLFWPVFLPFLFPRHVLKPPRQAGELDRLREEAVRAAVPELAQAIDAAGRLRKSVDELADLLAEQEAALAADEPALARNERARETLEARRADLDRIRQARDEQEARYHRVAGQVREAITRAHLAKFSEASREELRKHLARLADEVQIFRP